MSDIRNLDTRLLDDAFDMHSGYVLDFSDRTMGNFFLEELNLDIDDPRWASDGTSKAKRLRYFLRTVDNATAARTIRALWDYRQAFCSQVGDADASLEGRVLDLIGRLNGGRIAKDVQPPEPARNSIVVAGLRKALIDISGLVPQQRGYRTPNDSLGRLLSVDVTGRGLAPKADLSSPRWDGVGDRVIERGFHLRRIVPCVGGCVRFAISCDVHAENFPDIDRAAPESECLVAGKAAVAILAVYLPAKLDWLSSVPQSALHEKDSAKCNGRGIARCIRDFLRGPLYLRFPLSSLLWCERWRLRAG